ncbi:hypothetical protein [Nonomuraea aridisoli]|nr:hypothetical protein [Nonomuraea aridisoli]
MILATWPNRSRRSPSPCTARRLIEFITAAVLVPIVIGIAVKA